MIAPGRARRPGAARGTIGEPTSEELETCPFCEGREDRTPPETFALADAPRGPDSPGWRVRVVPNLYPAFERQEVVVHTPRHVRFLAELTDDELAAVAETWQARAAAGGNDRIGYLHALVNEGREAGASLAHSHSQLVYMRERPPAVSAEGGSLDELLGDEFAVVERDGVVVVAHRAGRAPYELLIAPREPESDGFGSARLATALALLADAIRRLTALEGARPWNAWLHTGGRHWHIEVLPRLTVFAGVELGAGIYVNTLAPEEAARALRDSAS